MWYIDLFMNSWWRINGPFSSIFHFYVGLPSGKHEQNHTISGLKARNDRWLFHWAFLNQENWWFFGNPGSRIFDIGSTGTGIRNTLVEGFEIGDGVTGIYLDISGWLRMDLQLCGDMRQCWHRWLNLIMISHRDLTGKMGMGSGESPPSWP